MAHGATGLALYLSSADHKVPEFYGRASRREMLRTSDDAPGRSRYPGSVSPFSHPSTETPFRSVLGHRHITPFKSTRRRADRGAPGRYPALCGPMAMPQNLPLGGYVGLLAPSRVRCRPRAPPAGFRLFAYRYTAPTRRGAPELTCDVVSERVPQCVFFSRFTFAPRLFTFHVVHVCPCVLCMCVDFVCMCIGFGPGSPLAGHESVAESEQQRRPAASPPRSGVFCRMPAQS